MFGRLHWAAIPCECHVMITRGNHRHCPGCSRCVITLNKGLVAVLWREWITRCDPKGIGVMIHDPWGWLLVRGSPMG